MRKLFFFILLIVISASSFGQEVLIDLQSLPVKQSTIKKSKNQAKAKSALVLPFFDDFSKGFSLPDPDKWQNSYVLVNQTYAINPPTIGVATFDAINQYGKLYNLKDSIPADTLTSQPINLSLPESDSIYLSFQYQPKGLGEAPDTTDNAHFGCDSLVLEFFAVAENKWIRTFSVSAYFGSNKVKEKHHLSNTIITQKAPDISKHFFNVMLPITDERFRKNGFQFRFMNYASFPPNTQYPSIRGNGDHWHIDLVYLDSGRIATDTILNDVAFSKPIKSFLKNYESIPWKHFTSQAMLAELTNPLSFKIQYRYLGAGPQPVNLNRVFTISNLSIPNNSYEFTGDVEVINPFQTIDYSRGYEYAFLSNWSDSAKYSMECRLEMIDLSPTPYLNWNDTARYTQQFFNYYAYDDGSAEKGYGLYGEGAQNGMVALKYHTYVSDSLKGILIYFNQLLDFGPKNKWFDLVVWNNNNGKPGTELYRKTVLKPTSAYNKDTLYKIDEKLKLSGDFWIGTVNSTDDMLNIGFDLNNNHGDRLYYNLTGTWVNSTYEGSLMMKPVFGKFALGQTGIEKPAIRTEFTIYPNPATNQISINLLDGEHPEKIRIVNLAGQIVLSKPYDSNSIDVSNLSTGIYLFQLTLRNQTTTTKKLVIIK